MNRPFYRNLYAQVLLGILLGVILGIVAPEKGAAMRPLGDGFIKLIKMLIGPIVFATITVGIARMGAMRDVGRIGIRTLVYFEVVSTLALIIGLAVVNILQPGHGLHEPVLFAFGGEREIRAVAGDVEIQFAVGRDADVFALQERNEAGVVNAHPLVVDRASEHQPGQRDLTRRQWPGDDFHQWRSALAALAMAVMRSQSPACMVAFGGEDLQTLYITTAGKRPAEELAAFQLTGKILSVRMPVAGRVEPAYLD